MYIYPFPIVRVFDVYLKSYQDGNLTCAEYFDNWYNKDIFVQKYFRFWMLAMYWKNWQGRQIRMITTDLCNEYTI